MATIDHALGEGTPGSTILCELTRDIHLVLSPWYVAEHRGSRSALIEVAQILSCSPAFLRKLWILVGSHHSGLTTFRLQRNEWLPYQTLINHCRHHSLALNCDVLTVVNGFFGLIDPVFLDNVLSEAHLGQALSFLKILSDWWPACLRSYSHKIAQGPHLLTLYLYTILMS